MYEIIKTYKQEISSIRFIGIKYGNEDRVNGNFGSKWGDWFQSGRFEKLETLVTDDFNKEYEDSYAYVGLMRWKEEEKFEYWIGMFLPEGTVVPEGYDYVDFSASNLGVCWVRGYESEVYCKEDKCNEKLTEEGYEVITDKENALWFFERYGCPRFTQKNEEGKIILDICHFVK